MNDIALMIVLGALMLTIGVGMGFWIGLERGRGLGRRARRVQAELDEYRQQVTDHFSQTATHFQSLGQQYKALYEHMASGAERLCDGQRAERELSFAAAAMLPRAGDGEPDDQTIEAKADADATADERRDAAGESTAEASSAATGPDEAVRESRPAESTAATEPGLPETETATGEQPRTYH